MAEPKTLIRLREDEQEITALQTQQTINTTDIATLKTNVADLTEKVDTMSSKDIATSANTVLDSTDGLYKDVKTIEVNIATKARTMLDTTDNQYKDVKLIKVNSAKAADTATTAETATSAQTATSAETATNAETATKATKADLILSGQQYVAIADATVAFATNAGTANHANTADSASTFTGSIITANKADMVLDENTNTYNYVKNIKMTNAIESDRALGIVDNTQNSNNPVVLSLTDLDNRYISLTKLKQVVSSAKDFADFQSKIKALT